MRFIAVIAGVALLGAAGAAHAYVRSRSQRGTPLRWSGACVFVQPDSGGSIDLPPDTVAATVEKALDNWQTVTRDCGYLQLHYDQPAPREAHPDGVNVVKFRGDRWCHPNDEQDHDVCFAPEATAITTVFFLDDADGARDGIIFDADIELNEIDFTFVTVVEGQPLPAPRKGTLVADLENTLTHELGHLQGLDHTCSGTMTPAGEVDESGARPPSCDALFALPAAQQSKIREATMFYQAPAGETRKRSPEADDVAGICAIYPRSAEQRECRRVDLADYQKGGCDAAAGGGGVGWWLAVIPLWLAARRRSWTRNLQAARPYLSTRA